MIAGDYYAILEVQPHATPEEIRAAYKRLAFNYHPDLSRDPAATRRMQLLNEAFEVLTDPLKRELYDRERIEQYAPAPDPAKTESPGAAPTEAAPAGRARQRQMRRRGQRQPPPERAGVIRPSRAWFRKRLNWMFQLIFLVLAIFIYSLASGELNWLLVAAPVVIGLGIIVEMALRLRGTGEKGNRGKGE